MVMQCFKLLSIQGLSYCWDGSGAEWGGSVFGIGSW